MFKWFVISIVIVPVLLGVLAATGRRRAHGLPLLVALLFVYDVLYVSILYYLRHRWII